MVGFFKKRAENAEPPLKPKGTRIQVTENIYFKVWKAPLPRPIDFLTLHIKDQTREIQVSASIGISLYPRDSKNPLVLLKYADKAMYKAKAKGKRQFRWHLET